MVRMLKTVAIAFDTKLARSGMPYILGLMIVKLDAYQKANVCVQCKCRMHNRTAYDTGASVLGQRNYLRLFSLTHTHVHSSFYITC